MPAQCRSPPGKIRMIRRSGRPRHGWPRILPGSSPLPPLPPLAPEGTAFQRRVWKLLQAIPYGSTTTYGTLAWELGLSPASARAVGSAVGHNPISILIPCHRVLGADGRLTGYAGGLERKRFLLELEQRAAGS